MDAAIVPDSQSFAVAKISLLCCQRLHCATNDQQTSRRIAAVTDAIFCSERAGRVDEKRLHDRILPCCQKKCWIHLPASDINMLWRWGVFDFGFLWPVCEKDGWELEFDDDDDAAAG